jgi:hypothetical protein
MNADPLRLRCGHLLRLEHTALSLLDVQPCMKALAGSA